jgi:hypothetical protein
LTKTLGGIRREVNDSPSRQTGILATSSGIGDGPHLEKGQAERSNVVQLALCGFARQKD